MTILSVPCADLENTWMGLVGAEMKIKDILSKKASFPKPHYGFVHAKK
jgi:hypothetical protein